MDQTKKKVLLIDDDTFLLDMYSLKFSKGGYDVKTVDSTELAMKILHEGYVPDVILADIVMPVMDGLDLIATIRKEGLVPNASIIMLTNQGASDDIVRAKKMGVDGYIVKATTIPSEILIEMEKIINNKYQKS